MLENDTIAALSTPPGEGAIAIVRVSGPAAFDILKKVFSNPRAAQSPRTCHLGTIRMDGHRVDSGLAVAFRAPASYTGEDMAEISCHGGVLVSAQVLETVLSAGARAAEPGEFTRRAFLNGKMDLTQAEAVIDIIQARAPLALRAAQRQLEGDIGKSILSLREFLLRLVANIEAWIDFPDEDIDPRTGQEFEQEIIHGIERIREWLHSSKNGRILREGVGLVLYGAPNVGKSSLLNRLLRSDRAIVADIPGTTRDTIEEEVSLGGLLFRITDTAGLRDTSDPLERLGVERTRQAIESADILLHVIDASRGDELPAARPDEIRVLNKCDLVPGQTPSDETLRISCRTGEGIDQLIDTLIRQVPGHSPQISAAAINARHSACLKKAEHSLQHALGELRSAQSPEFVAQGLHSALDAIGEVVGKADTEEILGEIFSRFCIGK